MKSLSTTPPSSRFKRLALPNSKIARTLIVITAALLLFFVLFDWDWLRPAILRSISKDSHRTISASHLDVDFSWSLQPTIRLHDLYIANAAWAEQPLTAQDSQPKYQKSQNQKPQKPAFDPTNLPSQRPLIAVKEIAFSFAAFKMLFAEKRLISRIYIRDGEVNLEQLENGVRNWRLLEPGYTGPGKYIIMALQAENSTIRFRHHGIRLELQAVANPYAGTLADDVSKSLTNAIALQGNYKGSAFDGELHTGPLLTFQRTGVHFPIDGYIHSTKTRLGVRGELGDLFLDQHIDADLSMSGNTVAAFNPFLNMHLPSSPGFEASAHLVKQQNRYRATGLKGKLGGTDMQGELTYINHKQQPLLEGKLSSKTVSLDELTAMSANAEKAGADKADASKTKNKDPDISISGGPSTAKRQQTHASHLFSSTPIPIAGLNARDIHLALTIGQLRSSKWPALENINATMALDKGQLKLQPLHATLQGSSIHAQFQLLTAQQPLTARLNIDISKLPMQHLLANTQWSGMVSAPLSVKVDMQGKGSSMAQILADASGNMHLELAPGNISNKLDAKLGLDAGKMLWLAVRGDKSIAMHCAVVDMAFTKGKGSTRILRMDSAQTTVAGSGNINLRDETLNILLIPHPKDASLFSFDSAIAVTGPLQKPAIKLHKTSDQEHSSFPHKHAKTDSGC